ncbi:MAG: hypothetical protein IJO09_07230 [Oscillospiraceae bacterium]|nr:hypothetical protein [Oscillospiraceae bacterium]
MRNNFRKRIASLIVAICMIAAFVPSVSASEKETEERESVVVQFANVGSSTEIAQINPDAATVGLDVIKGTNYATIASESSSYTTNQIKNYALNVTSEGTKYFMLQAATIGTVWTKAYKSQTVANTDGVWTIEVDMGTGASAGWYNLDIQGAKWYVGGVYDVYVDGERVGSYDCRNAGGQIFTEQDIGNVYISPNSEGKTKIAFVLKEQRYNSAESTTLKSDYARVLIHKLTLSPIDAPVATAQTVSVELSWDTMFYADKSTPSADWMTYGFELALDKGKMTSDISRYTAQSESTLTGKKFTQIQTGPTVWPYAENAMFTIKKQVNVEGWYRVDVQGILNVSASDYAIYVNGEYAGDYNFDNTETTSNKLGEKKQLNTVYLNAGENEISFRLRAKNYSSSLFIPYLVELVPASKPVIDTVSTTASEKTLENGAEESFTAQVRMTDGTYRSFGYNNDGSVPTTDDVVIVTSSNEDVIEVTECINAKTVASSDLTSTVDPTTVSYTIKAVGSGTADITVSAIVNGDTKCAEAVTITVPGAEEITDTTVNFKASAYEGGSVSNANVQEVTMGTDVTVSATANEGYTFAYWKNSAGVVLSTKAEETFKVNTNTAVIAVFDKATAEGENIPVYFYNGNGIPLGNTSVAKDTTFGDAKTAAAIGTPSLTGFAFDKWSIDDNALITALTRAVALYKDDETKSYTVKNGDTTVASGLKYGESVTVNGSDNFTAWKLGEKVISYDKSFTFDVYGNITLTEVTETMTKAPVLVLDKVDGNYFLTYDEGDYELIEAGILFGSEGVTIGSFDGYKSTAKKGTGQFTALPHEGATAATVARGYMIYKDGSTYKVLYAD